MNDYMSCSTLLSYSSINNTVFIADCCPILRLSSTNEDTKKYWNTKLGLYKYHSLDNNGSAVYKHISEENTYLYRSPLGNWLVST